MRKAIKVADKWTLSWVLIAQAMGAHAAVGSDKTLRIYFIDVEGGQSTLVVTPERKSLLIDTGNAGDGEGFKPGDPHRARDANRIVSAAHDGGARKIDYLLITHFHDDHDGGVRELSQLMPINTFIDHGAPSPEVASNAGTEQTDAYGVYASVRSGRPHIEPQPGERLPIAGIVVTVVSSAGATIKSSLRQGGSESRACEATFPPARDPYENPRSTGVLIEYGSFRFLDVGDLSGEPLASLVCPKDLVGKVDAYLVAHHGGPDVASPAVLTAITPRVAIMNNGVHKGGAINAYDALHEARGLEDVWQLHRSEAAGGSNYSDPFIANLDESTSYWIKLEAHADGSFRVLNARTGLWKAYPLKAARVGD